MKLVVEILTGSLFYVEVEDAATIADLRRKIASQENLPEKRLTFQIKDGVYQPLMTEDDLPLVDYGICDGCVLYLFFTALVAEDDSLYREGFGDDYLVLDESES